MLVVVEEQVGLIILKQIWPFSKNLSEPSFYLIPRQRQLFRNALPYLSSMAKDLCQQPGYFKGR